MFAEVKEPWEEEYASHSISLKDLYVATKGFKDSELLGSGGFGKVYKETNTLISLAIMTSGFWKEKT
ncbi:hypothetical protein BVRB_6g150080 [Beta vulgaris subsp. vulgaris]|nr:hypothetical protein BVRB_6g150080 [Beta vulgaris subsp. vulgaris]